MSNQSGSNSKISSFQSFFPCKMRLVGSEIFSLGLHTNDLNNILDFYELILKKIYNTFSQESHTKLLNTILKSSKTKIVFILLTNFPGVSFLQENINVIQLIAVCILF